VINLVREAHSSSDDTYIYKKVIMGLGFMALLIDPEAQLKEWVPSLHLVKESWPKTVKVKTLYN
jgi:hypothetical protein